MKRLTAWALLLSIYAGFIASAVPNASAQIIDKAKNDKMKNVPDGLKFRLSEGVEGAESRVKQPLASTDPMSERDTNRSLETNS